MANLFTFLQAAPPVQRPALIQPWWGTGLRIIRPVNNSQFEHSYYLSRTPIVNCEQWLPTQARMLLPMAP